MGIQASSSFREQNVCACFCNSGLILKMHSLETQTFLLKRAEPMLRVHAVVEREMNKSLLFPFFSCLPQNFKAAGGDFESRMNYGFD